MEPFDPFASDREEDDDETEDNLFSHRARKGLAVNGAYEEEFYHEVETSHMAPLGLGCNDDFDFDFDDEDDEESVSQHEDVFGMSLAEVDLWDDDDDDDHDRDRDDPFASPKKASSNNIEFPGFTSESKEEKSEKKRDSLKKTSSKTRISSSSKDGKRRSSTSSSRKPSQRSQSLDDVDFLAPELSSSHTMKATPRTVRTESERSERRSQTSTGSSKVPSRSRQPPPRSKSSDFSKDDLGDKDRVGELLDLIKKEKAQDTPTRKDRASHGGSERSDRAKHHHSTADGDTRNSTSSLRQKLMSDKAATAPSDKRRLSSSAASTSSSGKKGSSSGKDIGRKSFDESMSSWNDMTAEKRHPPRRTSSKTTNKSGDGRVGLDSFMKSNRTSRRGDAEHRSVVSAPATTSAETLSKKCQELKMTF